MRRLWEKVRSEKLGLVLIWAVDDARPEAGTSRPPLFVLRGHKAGVSWAIFSGDILVTTSLDGTIKLWNVGAALAGSSAGGTTELPAYSTINTGGPGVLKPFTPLLAVLSKDRRELLVLPSDNIYVEVYIIIMWNGGRQLVTLQKKQVLALAKCNELWGGGGNLLQKCNEL